MVEDTKDVAVADPVEVEVEDQVVEEQVAPPEPEPVPVAGGADLGAGVGHETGLLTAVDILAHADVTKLEHVDVAVPEWTPGYTKGGSVPARNIRIRVMNGDEAIEFAAHQADEHQRKDAMIRLVCKCAVDVANAPIFTEAQLHELGGLSFAVLQRLQNKALVLNGFAEEDDAQAEAGKE